MMTFEEEWRERFGRYATRHQVDHLISGWSSAGLRERVSTFEKLLDGGLLPDGARVLELGCGAGTYVRLLGARGHRVVGLDYSLPSLSRAKTADPSGAGRYLAGGAYALPFAAASLQAVICIGVLQVLDRPGQALDEMTRVLQPGGLLLVETLNAWNPVALARRFMAFSRQRSTRLHYGSVRGLERLMAVRGARPRQRVPILPPPLSFPAVATRLRLRSVDGVLRSVPGLRTITPHAFWVVGVRT
jgi:SAM-dependent methyltransferase